MFRLRYNGVQPSVMADGRMVSSQFWSVGSSKLSRLPCGTRVSFRSQFGYGWGVFPICLRSVYFPSWDHWVFRAAWLIWLLAASCSGCGIMGSNPRWWLMVEWFQASSDPWDPPNSHGFHAAQESASGASLDMVEECFRYVWGVCIFQAEIIGYLELTDSWLSHVPGAACSAEARDMTPPWSWHEKREPSGLVKVQRGVAWCGDTSVIKHGLGNPWTQNGGLVRWK